MRDSSETKFVTYPGIDGQVNTDPVDNPDPDNTRYWRDGLEGIMSQRLAPIVYGHPEPGVQFRSGIHFASRMGHPPNRPDLSGTAPEAETWLMDRSRRAYQLELTEPAVSAIRKVTTLLNGEAIRNAGTRYRLLCESLPDMDAFLTPDEFDALHPDGNTMSNRQVDTPENIEKAFDGKSFYQTAKPTARKPFVTKWVAGQKCRYHPTPYGNALVANVADNERYDVPTPKWEGGLQHRLGVGLLSLWLTDGRSDGLLTYASVTAPSQVYSVDVVVMSSDEEPICGEVIADHNNRKHDVRTYKKTMELGQDAIPVYVFSSLKRAKTAVRAWKREGLLKLPRKVDNLDVERLRNTIKQTWDESQRGIYTFFTLKELLTTIFDSEQGSTPSDKILRQLSW